MSSCSGLLISGLDSSGLLISGVSILDSYSRCPNFSFSSIFRSHAMAGDPGDRRASRPPLPSRFIPPHPRSSQIGVAFRGFVAQAGAPTQARFWLGGVETLLPVHLKTHGPQAPSPATGRFGFQITQSSDHRITRSLPPLPPIPHLGFKKTYAIQPRGYPNSTPEDTPKIKRHLC